MCSSVSLRILITLFCTVYFCFGVVYDFLGWYVPYLLILSIGSIIGGVILTAAHIIDALSSIIGGILADISSRRLIAGVGALLHLSACLLLVIGVIARDPLFLAMSVIAAELTAIKGPALGALLADNVPREVIGRVSSICSLAVLVWSAIGASLLVYTFKLSIEMFLLTVTTLCLLPVPLLIMLREHRPSRKR